MSHAQIPSHLRFLMSGIQDRATDLALLGHTGVKVERQRITAQLACVLGISSYDTLDEALAEARREMAAMIDHLNALIDQEAAR